MTAVYYERGGRSQVHRSEPQFSAIGPEAVSGGVCPSGRVYLPERRRDKVISAENPGSDGGGHASDEYRSGESSAKAQHCVLEAISMKRRRHTQPPKHLTFGELTKFMRAQLKKHATLKRISRSDYASLITLERDIFPGTPGLFDGPCIRHAMQYYNYSIVIGKDDHRIESYFSFFPLTKNGFDYCIRHGITTICHFPAELFRPRQHKITSIFLEVLATTNSCPYSIKADTIEVAINLLRRFWFLPFLSCPVSKEGLRILNKLGFKPTNEAGLNKLYLRLPQKGRTK